MNGSLALFVLTSWTDVSLHLMQIIELAFLYFVLIESCTCSEIACNLFHPFSFLWTFVTKNTSVSEFPQADCLKVSVGNKYNYTRSIWGVAGMGGEKVEFVCVCVCVVMFEWVLTRKIWLVESLQLKFNFSDQLQDLCS